MSLVKNSAEILFFGSLRRGLGDSGSAPFRFELQGPLAIPELLSRLDIPPGRVQLVMVNHRAVGPDHLIHPGDRVALFPREYAIFADWKQFRL